MATFKVPHVKLVAQPGDAGCWCASLLMLYGWAKSTGRGSMKNPLAPLKYEDGSDDNGIKTRWDTNMDWSDGNNGWLARNLQMRTHDEIPVDYDGMLDFLTVHGPLWTGGTKVWSGPAHGHVVVCAGCRNDGVFIMDPEPVGRGSTLWLDWGQFADFIMGSKCDVSFMTAA